MPPVARKDDVCTGHGCFGSRAAIQGSPNVFANNKPVHRVSDAWETHCCGPACHDGHLAEGSPNVFANGLAVGRIGDPVDCGSKVQTGSPDVIVN